MGWLNVSATGGMSNTDQTSNAYGNKTPIISDQFKDAYGNLTGSMNSAGANPTQQLAVDKLTGQLNSGQIGQATSNTNYGLADQMGGYGNLSSQLQGMMGYNPSQINSPTATMNSAGPAQTSAGTSGVVANSGASQALPYMMMTNDALIDPTLKQFDLGTAKSLSALDARTAGAGAWGNQTGFANDRSGLAYGDLLSTAGANRGALASQLYGTALDKSFGYGQQDASRSTTASAANAQNTLSNNQYNAGAYNNMSQFNAGQANDTSRFNANLNQQGQVANQSAGLQNQQQKTQVLSQIASNLQSQAGINQQMLSNIVTAQGIDTQAAQNLFAAGSITQSQLESILNAAQSYNGSSYTDNKTSNSNTKYAQVTVDNKII